MSSFDTEVLPSRAAEALAAFIIVMSALWPSIPKAVVIDTMPWSILSSAVTDGRSARAFSNLSLRESDSPECLAMNPSGSESKAILLRTTSILDSTSLSPATSTERPNLSRSCGLRSPSSGFMVPTRTKRDGWENDTPSLST